MATINHLPRQQAAGVRAYRHVWQGLGLGDDGQAVKLPGAADRTIQVFGSFTGGASVTFECSLEATPTNWFPCTDLQGNAISLSAAGGEFVVENAVWYRPRVVSGDGSTDIDVVLFSRGTK